MNEEYWLDKLDVWIENNIKLRRNDEIIQKQSKASKKTTNNV
jgi:hypothetical protein